MVTYRKGWAVTKYRNTLRRTFAQRRGWADNTSWADNTYPTVIVLVNVVHCGASVSYTGMVFAPSRCVKHCFTIYPCLIVEEINNKSPTWLSFTHAFTCTLATTQLDVVFIVYMLDPFTMARIGSYILFFPLH